MDIIITKIDYRETWHIRQQVMWPDKPLTFVQLANDNLGVHYGLKLNDMTVSIISLFISGEEAQFRKFATLKQYQGRGFGTKLLLEVMRSAKALKVKKIWCNARQDKTGFYEKQGLVKTQSKFNKAGINYVIMEKYL